MRSDHLSFTIAAILTDSKSIHSTISIVLDYSTPLAVGCVICTCVSRVVVGGVVTVGCTSTSAGSFGPVM